MQKEITNCSYQWHTEKLIFGSNVILNFHLWFIFQNSSLIIIDLMTHFSFTATVKIWKIRLQQINGIKFEKYDEVFLLEVMHCQKINIQ